ncbi:MAG: hypothetical protein O9301_03205 [Leptospira sp.]|nr:hypothetical protein [Leptospira sp.]
MYSSSPDLKLTDFQQRKLAFGFYELGVHSAIVFLGEETVFHYGPENLEPEILSFFKNRDRNKTDSILPLGELETEDSKFEVILLRETSSELPILSVLLIGSGHTLEEKQWNLIRKRMHTFLATGIASKEKTVLDFLQILAPIQQRISNSLSSGSGKGVLVFFHLQDLSPFFKPLGVMKSQEILREVMGTLHSVTKSNEFSFQINLRSYFIFCPDETVSGAGDRFESLYFPSKHVILDYKLKIFPINGEIMSDRLAFSEFFLENF